MLLQDWKAWIHNILFAAPTPVWVLVLRAHARMQVAPDPHCPVALLKAARIDMLDLLQPLPFLTAFDRACQQGAGTVTESAQQLENDACMPNASNMK
jgi:hypothetical protein